MARRDALLRLHKSLLSRRADIRKKLADELDGLRNLKGSSATGDSADVAFEAGSEEMASQLAYGLCEGCGCKIPIGRLNALPYTTLCITCQREMEKYPDWADRRSVGNWDKVYDADSLEEQREVSLSEIEIDLSSNR